MSIDSQFPQFRRYYGPRTRLLANTPPLRVAPNTTPEEVRRAQRVHEALGKIVLRDEGRRHDSRLRRMAEDMRKVNTARLARRAEAVWKTELGVGTVTFLSVDDECSMANRLHWLTECAIHESRDDDESLTR